MGRAWIVCLLCAACSRSEETPIGGTPSTECGLAEIRVEGGCEPAGLPASACAPGEKPVEGACVPAGVPPERCPTGFAAENGGCYPILPAEPCVAPAMALPGDTTCRALVNCAAGRYGDIPVESNTQYVDASWTGQTNGTADEPWTSVQDAIDAAAPGAIVAIAAGSYLESIFLEDKAVRVWGKCPDEVEIVGSNSALAALELRAGADGSEIHSLAVRGPGVGIALSAAANVIFDGVRVHATEDVGVLSAPMSAPTSFTLAHSLVEGARDAGVLVWGVEMDVVATLVRDIRPWTDGTHGNGIAVLESNPGERPTIARIADSMIERTLETGIYLQGSSATIERSVVRDTSPDSAGEFGEGIAFFDDPEGVPSSGAVIESTIERNHDKGIYQYTGDVQVDAVTVHHHLPNAARPFGIGIVVRSSPESRATSAITHTLLDANSAAGIFVEGADATVDSVWIRDTAPNVEGYGVGILMQSRTDNGEPAAGEVRYSVVERSTMLGIGFAGADGVVEATAVRDIVPSPGGYAGVGIAVQWHYLANQPESPASLTVLASSVERTGLMGIYVIGDARIERSLIRDTRGDGAGLFGDGITLHAFGRDASLALYGSRIEQSLRAGLSTFGGVASLETNAIVCNGFDLNGEPFESREPRFDDLGNNGCGCSEPDGPCKSVTVGLEPPDPLGTLED